MIAATFGPGQVAYSLLWFFLFFVEIWLMISVFIDIFRSHDLAGWAKAAWIILVLVFPIVGILAYLIIRGDRMRAHQVEAQADSATMFREYLAQAGGGRVSKVEELHRLAELRDRGYVSPEEFEELKTEIMNQDSGAHL
jgi:Phospholipase_D-nuclease N-terminal/Short C-terminal domain